MTKSKKTRFDSLDSELISKIKNENSLDSYNELVQRHTGSFVRVLNNFAPTLIQVGIHYNDAAQDKNYLFGLAISSFDLKKNVKFVTWFTLCTKYHFLNLINRCQNYDVSLDNELLDFISNIPCKSSEIKDQNDLLKHFEHVINEIEDKNVRDILFNRYFSQDQPNLKQISKNLSMKTSSVYNLHKRGLQKMKSIFNFENVKDNYSMPNCHSPRNGDS